MGFEYALVHLKFTIPLAIALTFIYRPICTRLDVYKILFLIAIAVAATTPWDSYLIRRKIWTYPSNVIVGPTFFSIPIEEGFFFVIQTYITCLLYLLFSTPVLKPAYLVGTRGTDGRLLAKLRARRAVGQIIIFATICIGAVQIWTNGKGTYLGLILAWAGPFTLLLWTLAYQFLGNLPSINVLAPIIIPTLYLWGVDTLALKRGTWSIESGTKLGIYLWDGLEIEESVFFLATNVLIVFGLVAFENAMAILEAFPALFPEVPALPSPILLIQALLTSPANFDDDRIKGIQESVDRLKKKSRSFYLASSVFQGRLRIDLILLYSFCRVADDLVDNAESKEIARAWISKLSTFLHRIYSSPCYQGFQKQDLPSNIASIVRDFPPSCQSALLLLPTSPISPKPIFDLLRGFETDLGFPDTDLGQLGKSEIFPIKDECDLELYASRVAGTVAELCIELVFYHSSTRSTISQNELEFIVNAGGRMGIALQYVNIARDIATDAAIQRVYLPTSWLEEEGLSPQDIISNPKGETVEIFRRRILGKAFNIYAEAKGALANLPPEARAPMRVAVESYMEIGRVLREKGYKMKAGKATVPKTRRIRVAWKALNEG